MIKPASGQVWESESTTITLMNKSETKNWDFWNSRNENGGAIHPIHEKALHDYYKFVPQTDLEWLAVNLNKWGHDGFNCVELDNKQLCYVNKSKRETITKQQWQQKRIELGLDKGKKKAVPLPEIGSEWVDKLRDGKYLTVTGVKIENGLSFVEYIEGAAIDLINRNACLACDFYEWFKPKKGKEMIDLSDAKVGDEFELSTGDSVELMLIGDKNAVTKNCSGRYRAVKFSGDYGSGLSIVKKIDPNAWWKDLPPAEWFELFMAVTISRYSNDDAWLAHDEHGNMHTLNLDIKVNEHQLIDISDLKKWQEEQK